MTKKQRVIVPHYMIDVFGRDAIERSADKMGLEVIFTNPTEPISKWRVQLASWLYDVADKIMGSDHD